MAFVERYPRDLSVFYGDEYFRSSDSDGPVRGYSDHDVVSAHSTRWAAGLVSLMRSSGAVLDVGCASGDLLSHLGPGLERFGIEPNAAMASRCRASGIEIIGGDICDPAVTRRYRGRFAVVTAIAVLEHVTDIAGALRQIRALLAPRGILLFEVPLISETIDSSVWFRSSLEHVYYPTVEGLQNLVEQTFGKPLVGEEIAIQGYGATFIGLVGADEAAQAEATRLHERLFRAPGASLVDPREVTFRFLLDMVHSARRGPEELALLARADGAALAPEIRARLAALWRADAERGGQVEALEHARDHFRTQAANWEREAESLGVQTAEARNALAKLQEAQEHSRAQVETLEREARAAALAREGLQGSIGILESARDHFRSQAENWEREACGASCERDALAVANETLRKDRDRLGTQIESLDRDVQDLRAQHDEMGRVRADLLARLAEAEKARDLFCTQATDWKREAEGLGAQAAEARNALAKLQEAQEHSRAQAESWEQQARATSCERDVLAVANEALRADRDRLRAQVESLDRDVQGLRGQHDEMGRVRADLLARLAEAERARDLLFKEVEESKRMAGGIAGMYQELRAPIEHLDRVLANCWRRETDGTARPEAFPDRIKALEDACNYHRAQAENWEAEARSVARMREDLLSYIGAVEKARDYFRALAEDRERHMRSAPLTHELADAQNDTSAPVLKKSEYQSPAVSAAS